MNSFIPISESAVQFITLDIRTNNARGRPKIPKARVLGTRSNRLENPQIVRTQILRERALERINIYGQKNVQERPLAWLSKIGVNHPFAYSSHNDKSRNPGRNISQQTSLCSQKLTEIHRGFGRKDALEATQMKHQKRADMRRKWTNQKITCESEIGRQAGRQMTTEHRNYLTGGDETSKQGLGR